MPTDNDRLKRIEERQDRADRTISQLASAARVGFGWRAELNGQPELAEILREQQQAIEDAQKSARSAVTA
jgi:hypothetical protein